MKNDMINQPTYYTNDKHGCTNTIEGMDTMHDKHNRRLIAELKKAQCCLARIIVRLTLQAKPKTGKNAQAKPKKMFSKTCIFPACNKPAKKRGRYADFCNQHGSSLSKEQRNEYRAKVKVSTHK